MTENLCNLRVEELISACCVKASIEREYVSIAAFNQEGSLIKKRENNYSCNDSSVHEKEISVPHLEDVKYFRISGSQNMINKIEYIFDLMVG